MIVVALEVPPEAQALRGPERVRDLGLRAREAAKQSALRAGLPVPSFRKDPEGRPLPCPAYWSIAHTKTMVAGVVAEVPVGVDVECIHARERDPAVLDEAEAQLMGADLDAYFRAWVAKEAVLKRAGVGLSELSRAKITSLDPLIVWHRESHEVDLATFGDHVLAVTGRAEWVVGSHVLALDRAAAVGHAIAAHPQTL